MLYNHLNHILRAGNNISMYRKITIFGYTPPPGTRPVSKESAAWFVCSIYAAGSGATPTVRVGGCK